MIDPNGRKITYLRLSVTDRCDFRCVYCMSEDMTFLPKSDILSLEELERLCCTFIERGVKKSSKPYRKESIGMINSPRNVQTKNSTG